MPLGKAKPTKQKKEKRIPASKRRKKLVLALDKITSLYVREVYRRCVTCGSTSNLTCGHLITRAHYAVRWDMFNVAAQCMSCNLIHEYNPHVYTNWFLSYHGLDNYKALVARDVPKKWSEAELTEKLAEIQGLYDALQGRALYIEPSTIYRE